MVFRSHGKSAVLASQAIHLAYRQEQNDGQPTRQLDTNVSPLRQRMLEPKTQAGYLRAVHKLAGFLKDSLDSANAEDLRRFQLTGQSSTSRADIGCDLRCKKHSIVETVCLSRVLTNLAVRKERLCLPCYAAQR